MKIITNFLRAIILMALVAVIAVTGCFAAIFFVSRDEPEEIFIMEYALVFEKGEDEKLGVWFVEKADCADLENGDGAVYYDGSYCAANAMVTSDGAVSFYASDDLTYNVSVDNSNLVGRVIACWQQK
ncbi:MAG: hypothetical protein IJN38_10700 [Clostridia bacterium]|nr:hypothetical protein [Clostridia bacterium]